jgi:hypothetical protein
MELGTIIWNRRGGARSGRPALQRVHGTTLASTAAAAGGSQAECATRETASRRLLERGMRAQGGTRVGADPAPAVGVRWTIGDVSPFGFELLRLSAWGAWNILGPSAEYVVCVNTISVAQARELAGELPTAVRWRDVTNEIPHFVARHLDAGMAEGVGWKLAAPRIFPDRHELALDNDCILWELPTALGDWLAMDHACLVAADVVPCFGQFTPLCGSDPRNTGIRGLPPRYDFSAALARALRRVPVTLSSETDEQGLQLSALAEAPHLFVIPVDDVSICSPFPPRQQTLGTCGAHFVGLNCKHLPWQINGHSIVEEIRSHWREVRGEVYERIGIAGTGRGSC